MRLLRGAHCGEVVVCPDPEELGQRAAERFVQLVGEAVDRKGVCAVALAGGSTPKMLYKSLASEPFLTGVAWPVLHLFWGDERFVPPDHPASNYRMVKETLLSSVPLPSANIHRVPTERGEPEFVAAAYQQEIRQFFGLSRNEVPRFDVVLLGMGEDGHTASLFPETPVLEESKLLVAATYVQQLASYRVTLTFPVLNHACNVIFLVSGEAKARALRDVLRGEYRPAKLPAQRVQPTGGALTWIVDRAAASKLLDHSLP